MAKRRIIEYDILKFFGALAVVIGHVGPIPKRYVIWAVPAFVFTTWALQRHRVTPVRNIILTYLNITFVYVVTILLALLCFGLEPARRVLGEFSFGEFRI